MTAPAPKTWFLIGYNTGLQGENFAPPENSFARNNYRLGFEAGDWRKTCQENGWAVTPYEQAKKAAGYY